MREQLFEPLRSAGWPLHRISGILREAKITGSSVPTLSRIASGERLPSAEVLNALLDLVSEVAGRPVPSQARRQLLALRLQALAVADPKSYRLEILEQDAGRLRGKCEGQIDQYEDAAMPAEADDHDCALPSPVLTLRADTAAHVEDVAAAGVPLPAGLMEPEPESTSTVLGVLYEIHDVLGHTSRALHRALAEADGDPDAAPAPAPKPSTPYTPPPALPSFDRSGGERGDWLAPAIALVLVVVLLVVGYVYLVPFLKKQRGTAAQESPSAPITATETVTPTGGPGGGSTPRPGPTPTPDLDLGDDPDPSPERPTQEPSETDTTITITDPATEEETGPVLGGRTMNAEPRLDSADCSQPIVFTFSAAAQRPGTIEFAWHPDEQLIARGVQDRAGTMTFTTTNEQQDQFNVQLTGTQSGERVQGSMTVEVTSPEADRGTNSASIDITCI
ncbi:helix-turn-helix domain-containing protein [Streptomyces sp. R11]|uniref:Helix-turn-helix domain-containing protein n=1 Tax=Streptomyces sp. R11 TaxID=3238625 RepID=A0AB39NEK1_9ACTN